MLSSIQSTHPTVMCPYCREWISNCVAIKRCEACFTPHHPGCWEEYGCCTVFGCTGRRLLGSWNFRYIIPSFILSAGMIDHTAAFALSPLYIPAFITLMIEIIYFGFVLIEQGLSTKTLRKDEITCYLTYLLINAVPFGLRFGAGLTLQ
jgi:hypothetical protein